jgi:hypothetical protein
VAEPQDSNAISRNELNGGLWGSGIVGSLCLLAFVVSRWSRWRGKSNQKKRSPESSGFSLSVKRSLLGRRKYEAKYIA